MLKLALLAINHRKSIPYDSVGKSSWHGCHEMNDGIGGIYWSKLQSRMAQLAGDFSLVEGHSISGVCLTLTIIALCKSADFGVR